MEKVNLKVFIQIFKHIVYIFFISIKINNMGCSAPAVIEDVDGVNIETLINQKATTIQSFEESKKVPDENELTQMVRLDIDISEQIENLNKQLEKKNNKKLRKKVELLIQIFNELIQKWKQINKDGKEEEELKKENEEDN